MGRDTVWPDAAKVAFGGPKRQAEMVPGAQLRVQRDNADAVSLPTVQRVVAAVIADEVEGNDGELYKAMGYVRRTERASGLTRGGHSVPVQPAIVQVAKAA